MLAEIALCSALLSGSLETNAVHPASQFVGDMMLRGQRVVEQESEKARIRGMCSLIKSGLARHSVGQTWLGDFANLPRERQAVQRFISLVPSIIVTKAVQAIGDKSTSGGAFSVSPTAGQRANGVFDVAVQVTDADGSSYSFKTIVHTDGKKYLLADVEYMGFSAVNYLARDYQKILREEYNRNTATSMPVTELIRQISSEDGFVRCP
jgi:hypothetical protein